MHILFLTDNFPPESNAPANRTFEHARQWVASGHRVTIITCAPNFPDGQLFEGYKNRWFQTEQMDGITVIRVWSFMTRNAGFVLRLLDFLSFMVSGFLGGLRIRDADIIIGTSPQFFTVCAAYCLAKVKHRPFVFEMRDIWPESLQAVGMSNAGLSVRLAAPLADYLYRRADHLIVVTHSFKAYLQDRGVSGERITVIPNGVDPDMFFPIPADISLQQELQLEDKFVVGYLGTHGLAHGLESVVEAARLAGQTDDLTAVHFITVGAGAQFDRIKEIASDLDNFTMIGQVSRADILRYWSLLDASLIHLKASPLFESVIPSKMFEAMAMGVPLLHGVAGESADIVRTSRSGICFAAEQPEALLSAIRQVSTDKDAYQQMKTSCLSSAQNYNRANLADRMADCLQGVVNSHD
ncbi:MAG: glycosyltransferase family 4 protein [Alphaproteobacteria bacterium]|nr:glycosyltransferase family 4 protein [Alphaproteobacteria bacterium]